MSPTRKGARLTPLRDAPTGRQPPPERCRTRTRTRRRPADDFAARQPPPERCRTRTARGTPTGQERRPGKVTHSQLVSVSGSVGPPPSTEAATRVHEVNVRARVGVIAPPGERLAGGLRPRRRARAPCAGQARAGCCIWPKRRRSAPPPSLDHGRAFAGCHVWPKRRAPARAGIDRRARLRLGRPESSVGGHRCARLRMHLSQTRADRARRRRPGRHGRCPRTSRRSPATTRRAP
jgi:hypothetical protein